MSLEIVKREDWNEGSDQAFISISHECFTFSTQFLKTAGIKPVRVTIYADPQAFKLGFEFHDDERSNSYAITARSRRVHCTSHLLNKKFGWVRAVSELPPKLRRFSPKKENSDLGRVWTIQLCPAFEERRARESQDIPSNARGIYRYLRENGEIVYIGRGEIRTRLHSPERTEWQFDVVEYSVIENPDQQVRWEKHWIDQFKAVNNAKLPFYNKISGVSFAQQNEPSVSTTTATVAPA